MVGAQEPCPLHWDPALSRSPLDLSYYKACHPPQKRKRTTSLMSPCPKLKDSTNPYAAWGPSSNLTCLPTTAPQPGEKSENRLLEMRTPDFRVLEGRGGLFPGPLTLCHGSLGVNQLPSLSRTEADFGSKWVGLGQERGCE